MYKKFVCIATAFIFLFLGGAITINVLHDPLFQYRNPFGAKPFEDSDVYYSFLNATYQVPGMAKNFDYDTLITGTSMTQNFDSSYFDELMGTNALKLSLSGGNIHNISSVMKMALEHNPKLTKIYSSLDDFALEGDPNKVGNQPPTYLLNENLFDDIEYILNKNVLINYTLNDLVITKQGKLLTEPRDRIFTWYGIAYGEEKVLSQYSLSDINSTPLGSDYYIPNAKCNLENWYLPLIEAYPEVEFNFFIPPYSCLAWNNTVRKNEVDAVLTMYTYATRRLLAYDNVHVYCFAGIPSVEDNLWNYKDSAHYHARINDFMTEAFASNSYTLTLDSLEEQMAAWKTHILSDDYERYFNNPLRDTTDFYTYVDKIHNNNYIIITMVGSESVSALPSRSLSDLRSLGLDISAESDVDCYVFCKNDKQLWQAPITTEKKEVLADLGDVQVKFADVDVPWNHVLSICIDGVEYSQNSRGISFVIYDKVQQRVIDSVAFDTNLKATRLGIWSDNPSYRKALRQKLIVKDTTVL